MWMILLRIAAVIIISAILNKQKNDTENAVAGVIDPNSMPTATETTPIAIVWGTVKIAGNQLWYGAEDNKPIISKVKTGGIFGLFESTVKTNVGFQYFLGMQIGLCQSYTGATTELVEWRIKDEILWKNTGETGSFSGFVDNKSFMGDFEGGAGGYQGSFTFYNGNSSQAVNPYLVSQLGDNVPAYNNLSYFVWNGGYHGNSETPDAWTFVVKRIPTTVWSDPAKNEINKSCNPALCLYEILTNDSFGLSFSNSQIDLVNFKEVHDRLYAEGLGYSDAVTSDVNTKEKINQIFTIIGGQFNTNSSKIQIKLNRGDYDVSTLEVIDKAKVYSITNDTNGSLSSIVNEVKVKFTDIENNFKPRYAPAQNNGAYFERAKVETVILDYPAITDPAVAYMIAARELLPLTAPLRKSQITVKNTDSVVSVGDVVVVNYPDEDYYNMIMRVTDVNYGNVNSSKIVLSVVEDHFGVDDITLFNPEPTNSFTPTDYTALPANLRYIEAPFYFNTPTTNNKVLTYATKPNKSHLNYELHTKTLGGPEFIYQSSSQSFTPSGNVSEDFDEQSTIIKLTNDYDIGNVTSNTSDSLNAGYNTALIIEGSTVEFINFLNISNVGPVYTISGINRALFDTIPQAFTTSAKIYFISYGFALNDVETYSGISSIRMKALTKTIRRTLDIADAPEVPFNFNSRKQRPIAVSNLEISGEAYKKVIQIGAEDLIISYSNRDRKNTIQYYDENVLVNNDNNTYNIKIYDNITSTLLKDFTTTNYSYIFDDEKSLNAGEYFNSLRVVIKTNNISFASLYEYDIIVNRV